MRERENGLCRGFFFEKAAFPFSRGKNRLSQRVENRGSLISVPLALRVWKLEGGSKFLNFQGPLEPTLFYNVEFTGGVLGSE